MHPFPVVKIFNIVINHEICQPKIFRLILINTLINRAINSTPTFQSLFTKIKNRCKHVNFKLHISIILVFDINYHLHHLTINYNRILLGDIRYRPNYKRIPWYKYKEASYTSTWYLREYNTIYQNIPIGYDYSKLKYHCYLKLLDSLPIFCGFGGSIREARMAAC